jgi:hypothetical protein
MVRTLKLQTGDVTEPSTGRRTFSISASIVTFTFEEFSAELQPADWPAFVEQIKTRSLARWKYSGKMPAPLGNAAFQRLLNQVNSTPSYQLFLASVDIAEYVRLVTESDDRAVWSTCRSLSGPIRSTLGPLRLFFLPDTLVTEADTAEAKELIDKNKLCELQAEIATYDPLKKYYMPYQTPQVEPVGKDATNLWERIRRYFYEHR